MSAEALARVLWLAADETQDFGGYSTRDSEVVARALIADPAPLLAALAEAGVLREEWGIPDGLAGLQKRTFHSREMAEALSNDRPVTLRYVTAWRTTEPTPSAERRTQAPGGTP